MRARKKVPAAETAEIEARRGLDVNAVVSYNFKAIRERQGWTQQGVAERLGQLTGHTLPQASISAMERGFDGDRRRRFDAHELYLLSVLFDVPIAYFFLPPPGTSTSQLADTGQPVTELYAALLGEEWQLAPLDERLAEIGLKNPEEADQALVAIFGAKYATGAGTTTSAFGARSAFVKSSASTEIASTRLPTSSPTSPPRSRPSAPRRTSSP